MTTAAPPATAARAASFASPRYASVLVPAGPTMTATLGTGWAAIAGATAPIAQASANRVAMMIVRVWRSTMLQWTGPDEGCPSLVLPCCCASEQGLQGLPPETQGQEGRGGTGGAASALGWGYGLVRMGDGVAVSQPDETTGPLLARMR